MQRPRALILDLDGTLILSNDAHARAWQQALVGQGLLHSFEEVRPLLGMGGDQLLPTLTGIDGESEQGKRLTKGWQKHFLPMVPGLQPAPGARELLLTLRELGLPYMLGTSGEAAVIDVLVERANVADLTPDRVTASDVENSKPRPDIVQVAAERLGVEPGQALMVGDTIFDAEAARKAGVPSLLLRCGGSLEGQELPEGVVEVLDDPAALAQALRAAR